MTVAANPKGTAAMSAPARVHTYTPGLPPSPVLGIDVDEEYAATVEPPELFTRPTLGEDPASAEAAYAALDEIVHTLAEALYAQLEPVEVALRQAAPHSRRAAEVRAHVRAAISGMEAGMVGLDRASITLTRLMPAEHPAR